MKHSRIVLLLAVGFAGSVKQANAQDYLYGDYEHPDTAAGLLTPFTEIEEPAPKGFFLSTRSTEPFIRDTVFSLEPRFYFRSLRNSLGEDNTFAGGGSLGFTTGWWNETVQLGVTGYMTQPIVAPNGRNRSGLVDPDGDGFFTLGQAWMKLRAGPATATLFRQTLNLPFINMNDTRMIPNTFEAYQIEAKFWDDFVRLNAGYVARMKGRNTPDFVSMTEIAGAPQASHGTAFAGFFLGSEEKTYLGVMGELTWDLFSCTYLQAGHTWKLSSDFELRGDLQFADQRSMGRELIGSFDTQLYGVRLSGSYQNAVLSFSYTKTAGGAAILDPYGADPGFNGLMISNFGLRGEQAFGFGLSYDFEKIGLDGLLAFGSYVYGALPGDDWEQEVNATVDYRVNDGLLKNFWLRVRYAHNEASGGATAIQDFRVILNHSIAF